MRHFERRDDSIDDPTWVPRWPELAIGASSLFLFERASTIYGGAREVQKNIIAKLAFGS